MTIRPVTIEETISCKIQDPTLSTISVSAFWPMPTVRCLGTLPNGRVSAYRCLSFFPICDRERSFTAYCLLLTAFCLPVARAHGRLDVSAHVEIAFQLYAQGIAGPYEIFENDVHHMLVKNLHVAK